MSTRFPPFFVNFGAHPGFEYLGLSEELVLRAEELVEVLQKVHEGLKVSLAKALENQEHFANQYRLDTPVLQPGDLI